MAHGGGGKSSECEVEGCTRKARGGTTLCISHGIWTRCAFLGCVKTALQVSQPSLAARRSPPPTSAGSGTLVRWCFAHARCSRWPRLSRTASCNSMTSFITKFYAWCSFGASSVQGGCVRCNIICEAWWFHCTQCDALSKIHGEGSISAESTAFHDFMDSGFILGSYVPMLKHAEARSLTSKGGFVVWYPLDSSTDLSASIQSRRCIICRTSHLHGR